MRHQKAGRKLGRNSTERKALFRNQVVSLFRHGRIKTTEAKAKELRRIAERLITISKRGTARAEDKGPAALLAARRRARVWVNDPEVLRKLFADFASRYAERQGGYTRIIRVSPRLGDGAPMALIELMPDEPKTAPAAEEKPAKRKKKAAAAEAPAEAAQAKPAKSRKKAAAKDETPAPAEAEAKPKRSRKAKKTEDEGQ